MRSVLSLFLICAAFLPAACTQNGGGQGEGLALALLALLAGSSSSTSVTCPTTTPVSGVYPADTVTSAPGATGSGFGDSNKAVNGVCGTGESSGSLDVFSLSQTGSGASITLEWAGKKVTNGTGIDFMVFENVFTNGSSSDVFLEAAIVEVSQDNSNWCGFNPDYDPSPSAETTHSTNPAHWLRFAGISPVLYNQDTNPLTSAGVFDESQAGGNGFDLSNLSDSNSYSTGCSTTLKNNIQSQGFTYLRIVAATNRTNADSGSAFPSDSGAYGGPDIDGVVARYLTSR